MAEELIILETHNKEEKYQSLLPQIQALVGSEKDLIANMANVAAALKAVFDFLWVGFYRVKNNELVLGPFQGPIACTRIKKGKGVCGKVWESQVSIIVPDVEVFPGHIACSSSSRSEIVVPKIFKEKVLYLLDVDSDQLDAFDAIDQKYLQKIIGLL
jgi:L-methionine (R)-S-oxide reductase|tara:strand:- start:129847 stop:130317 length:471 start_codon:yes stop_codon:yes gene_type:complete